MGDDIKEMALQNMIMKKVSTRESSPCRILWTDAMWNVNIPWASPFPPWGFELFKTGLFKFPWFPTPRTQVMIKCPGFARTDGKVSNRSTHNRYFKCKMRRFIVFWQEVEIHRNEVKLLDANNTKLEAEIRWMLCQFVFEIPLLAVWSLHPPFSIFREFFRKMSENKTTYCLK